ncbi:MAG: hypothetical protein ACRETW_11220 [Stenotrophobium sp.]
MKAPVIAAAVLSLFAVSAFAQGGPAVQPEVIHSAHAHHVVHHKHHVKHHHAKKHHHHVAK